MKKTRTAMVTIKDGHKTIRIDVDISGITAHNIRKIFERIGGECAGHCRAGSIIESVYFYEETTNENP